MGACGCVYPEDAGACLPVLVPERQPGPYKSHTHTGSCENRTFPTVLVFPVKISKSPKEARDGGRKDWSGREAGAARSKNREALGLSGR